VQQATSSANFKQSSAVSAVVSLSLWRWRNHLPKKLQGVKASKHPNIQAEEAKAVK